MGKRERLQPKPNTRDLHESSRDPELEVSRRAPHLSALQVQAGGGSWRFGLPPPPPPSPSEERSELHAAGKAASARRGAGRGADKSAAEAVRGRGGGPRRLEGAGARERARRRGVRCVLALERTQGPSRAFSILGALPGSPRPPPPFPSDLLPFSLESARAGDEDWQFDGRFVGLPPTPPASQRRLALTAASSGDHPSSGATSTFPVRSLSSLFPLK